MILMRSLLPITTLFFAISMLSIGFGLLMSLVGIQMKDAGLSDTISGIVNALFFAGAITSTFINNKLISSVGHIRSFGAFAAIATIAFLGFSLFYSEILWGFLRFLSGYAYFGLIMVIESWLNEKNTNETRGSMMAVYSFVFFISAMIGQNLLNLSILPSQLIILGSVFVLISLIAVAVTKIKEPNVTPLERYNLPKIATLAPLATVISLLAGILANGFIAMFPILLAGEGYENAQIASFLTVAMLGGLFAQFPVGRLSDRYGRKPIIVGVCFYLALVTGAFFQIGLQNEFSYVLAFLLGAGLFVLYPLSASRANDVIDEAQDTVEIGRTLLLVYGIGSCCSPLLIGFLMETYGSLFVFVIFSLLSLFAGIYAIKKDRVPMEDRSVYLNIPAAASGMMPELDPRQDEKWVEENMQELVEKVSN